MGKAQDTAARPAWHEERQLLHRAREQGRQNHPDSQYSLWTYVPGTYTVSAENGASCTVSH